ncbi:hypothetical protein A2714_01575 [Candidatus Woesebacteria bacterium RIFCSPHIGHO2_01_FULL_38_9]|uniref:Glycosyltransferase RgtA/B/C/D-like domain-containing protein n=2 Tax=Candidatus Woeseibacteriota TaxID=1752722 RepID=A0A1F7Y131_9BACT|nr:MAG: hypothetical protein A2714_01575 [Candidatus Woesebacteria bacterium RIFCSPHIGHO2_01_FULL_38_9]OGM58790.1 MAG: hypothetical protein A3A75_00700 [Candidatus Woesebacteria bacterium RIFCSPLOWO2_01_FULL_39_10]
MKVLTLFVFAFGIFLLTFKLTQIPPGIDTDEGSIAYNAALISETLHDRNGRTLPFFILSADKNDWKQPVLVYSSAVFFKFFGTSLVTFKLVNIIIAILTIILLFYLMKEIFPYGFAVLGVLIFFTTPAVIITSRIGNESVDPILFSTVWLLALYKFQSKRQIKYLILAAFSLGLGFYSFKGMRVIVPVWILISTLFIVWQYIKNSHLYSSLLNQKSSTQKIYKKILSLMRINFTNKNLIKSLIVFFVTLVPFFIIIPLLEQKYAGAVFDRKTINMDPFRHYLYYWISNLSLPSLFFKGDIGKIYEMPLYGFFSLGVLPAFLIGIVESFKNRKFYLFILVCYLATPLLFGFAGSLDYPHRLMASVPFFVIITTLGCKRIYEYVKLNSETTIYRIVYKLVTLFVVIFFIYNFADFSRYYYFEYPKLHSTRQAFGNDLNASFYQLSKIAKEKNLTAYIQEDIYTRGVEGNKFFEIAYFDKPLKLWRLGETLPPKSVLLTQNEHITDSENSGIIVTPLNILIRY